MTGAARRTPGEELLLARVSAAAGRERLGKRCATYAGAAHTAYAMTRWPRAIRDLLAFAGCGGRHGAKGHEDARLDLYEHGMTIAVKGRIHVVRYDSTAVFPAGPASRYASACTLTDVHGARVLLHGGPGQEDTAEWWSEIRRGVTRAQLSTALAALGRGERLTFGDVWLTREDLGYGEICVRWQQIRRVRFREGAVELDVDGTWHGLGSGASEIPNPFVLRALVESLGPEGAR
ncbi:hypothetical protein AF335_08770 [Streptomyces eurocidicus]|uniref:Uncharacterized protein n=1 Tax=Streptomyces eurocidicus TaxID=66423 RepID=A0A2N8P0S7_STREU|nr:DUF6585 family protein [Streptomyces eurocidicus]MBB5123188.1 hypothetical protein [Streptomyces eurocidicus]MBF6055456.1 hypothetical protein [Streptomyces eurocidicus]PNE34626.1 hypothetical protein AF335_08770 [Streptomyces eurocidicus]